MCRMGEREKSEGDESGGKCGAGFGVCRRRRLLGVFGWALFTGKNRGTAQGEESSEKRDTGHRSADEGRRRRAREHSLSIMGRAVLKGCTARGRNRFSRSRKIYKCIEHRRFGKQRRRIWGTKKGPHECASNKTRIKVGFHPPYGAPTKSGSDRRRTSKSSTRSNPTSSTGHR